MKKMIGLLILVLIHGAVQAATLESSARHTTLLELYSSEGCSSCPPADDWLREFRKPSNLWKDFVPVVFHVDYWDGLGWKDPFSSADFTARQEQYAQLWQGQTLFTPCVVINGRAWSHWERLKTLPAFNESPGVLKVETKESGQYQIIYSPEDHSTKNYEAHIALLGFDIESTPTRGENAGKNLKHDFIVLDYRRGAMTGDTSLSVLLSLNVQDARAKKLGVAVWVSESGSPIPLQATGGYL